MCLVTCLKVHACLQLKKLPESMCGVSMTCCCYLLPSPMEVCSCAVGQSANIPMCFSCMGFVLLVCPATCNSFASAVVAETELKQCIFFPAWGSPACTCCCCCILAMPFSVSYPVDVTSHDSNSCDAYHRPAPASPIGPCFSRFDIAYLHPIVQDLCARDTYEVCLCRVLQRSTVPTMTKGCESICRQHRLGQPAEIKKTMHSPLPNWHVDCIA